jgi:hypothetical protein
LEGVERVRTSLSVWHDGKHEVVQVGIGQGEAQRGEIGIGKEEKRGIFVLRTASGKN